MKFTLIIDTSTERALVAIANGFDLLFTEHLPFGFQSSRWLLPALIKGLDSLKMSVEDFKLIGCGIGPGLFTGIRVGVAFAKGLAISRSLPLLGFSSLEGFVTFQSESFVSCIDMRVGGYYIAERENVKGNFLLKNPQLVSKEDLLQISSKIVGPTVSKLNLPNCIETNADPLHLARWCEEKFQKKEIPSALSIDYQRLFF